jgi:hypothetical protein
VDSTVASVLDALDARGAGTDGRLGAGAADDRPLVAAVTARSMPDLASRLRAALSREGVAIGSIGIAAAGLHHVATLQIPGASRAALERAAAALGAQLSIVGGEDAR